MKAWRKLTLSFGLVNVPVSIAPAVESRRPTFNNLCGEHHVRLKQQNFCPTCDGPPSDVVKGLSNGDEFTIFGDSDLVGLVPLKDGAITLENFTPVGSIDPLFFKKPYLMWPEKKGTAPQGFTLLSKIMEGMDLGAVGSVQLDKADEPVVIRYSSAAESLVLHTCYYHQDVRWDELAAIKASLPAPPSEAEVEQGKLLIAQAVGTWALDKIEDSYAEGIGRLLEARGGAPVPSDGTQDVPDLMAALKASVAEQQEIREAEAERTKDVG